VSSAVLLVAFQQFYWWLLLDYFFSFLIFFTGKAARKRARQKEYKVVNDVAQVRIKDPWFRAAIIFFLFKNTNLVTVDDQKYPEEFDSGKTL
jgi:hypothetical protein